MYYKFITYRFRITTGLRMWLLGELCTIPQVFLAGLIIYLIVVVDQEVERDYEYMWRVLIKSK
jgi:hypothetical protein